MKALVPLLTLAVLALGLPVQAKTVSKNTQAEEEPIMMSGTFEISERTQKIADKFESDVNRGRLKQRTNAALNAAIRLAAYKLKRVGHKKEADRMIYEWEHQFFYVLEARGIGDHRPLSAWLAEKTAMLEFILGKDVMHALRLDDLITINYALPVVISCADNVDLEEYGNHFVEDLDNGYRGLGPVVVYWTSFFSCVGFTWGSGFLFCSPIAMGAEWITLNFVAPKLNEPLWKWACKPGDF